jgi:outer membrane immunogenic protein
MGAAMVALMVGVGGASAADIYSPAPVAEVIYNPAPAFSWTGGYAGGLIGYEWGNAKVQNGSSMSPDGFMGGVYAGYNFQTSNMFVMGLEGDFTLSGAEDKAGGVRVSNNWNGTLRARAGIALDRFMFYGTGGLAIGKITTKLDGGGTNAGTHAGWTVGAGMEAAVTNNVIARLEYRYTDYGKNTYDTAPKTKVDFNSSQVMAGIGFKF